MWGGRSGAGGGGNNSPQFSGRQTGAGQSFPQIMGFLDRGGGGAAGKARIHFAQHLAVSLKLSVGWRAGKKPPRASGGPRDLLGTEAPQDQDEAGVGRCRDSAYCRGGQLSKGLSPYVLFWF